MYRKGIFVLILTMLFILTACSEPAQQEETTEYDGVVRTHGDIIFTLNPHMYQFDSEETVLSRVTSSLYRKQVSLATSSNLDYVPEIADSEPQCVEEGIEQDEQCHIWQVSIRHGLKMQDGTPFAADILMDSYELLLDPSYQNYNSNVFYSRLVVENAYEYNQQYKLGNELSFNDVGIKRVDAFTIEFTLDIPEENNLKGITNMMSYLSVPSLTPVNKQTYENLSTGSDTEKFTNYGDSIENFIGSGPYNLVQWNKEERDTIPREYMKNQYYLLNTEQYVDRFIEQVYYGINDDLERSAKIPHGDFQAGLIDYMNIPVSVYEDYEELYNITTVETTTVWNLVINADERQLTSEQLDDCWKYREIEICYYDKQSNTDLLLSNQNFRKALYFLLDRKDIQEELLPGQKPTNHILSDNFITNPETKERYRDTLAGYNVYEDYEDETYGYNLDRAIDLYNQAREEIDVSNNTEIRIGIQVPSGDKTLVNLANYLKTAIEGPDDVIEPVFQNLKIEIEEVDIEEVYTNMINGHFDISFAPLSGDANDPYTTLFNFHSDNTKRFMYEYNNETVDNIYNGLVQNKDVTNLDSYYQSNGLMFDNSYSDLRYADNSIRLELLALQESLVLQDMYIIPIYEEVKNFVYQENLVLPFDIPVPIHGFGDPVEFQTIKKEQ